MTKRSLRVSVVIPAKNEAANIGNCLSTVFSIDFPADQYEVIVVDNGSSDDTVAIAEKWGAKVHVLADGHVSTLRNYGVRVSRGEVIAFLDADCSVRKDWLRNAEQYFSRPDIACFGSAPQIPLEPTWVQRAWYVVRRKKEMVGEIDWLESMNMFVRKELFEKIGGFNEKLVTCEDVDLSYRLSQYGPILSDRRIVAFHHGEARDIAEFFKKERWRGKGNYIGLHEHGFKLKEVPSLVLPLSYLLFGCATLLSLVVCQGRWALAAALLWQGPVVMMTLLKVWRARAWTGAPALFFLYNVYFLARGIAGVMSVFKRRRECAV